MTNVRDRLTDVHRRIVRRCAGCGRDQRSVQLIAVSKTQPAGIIVEAARAGQNAFGESYLQEALDKMTAAEAQAERALEWHFIGPVQSNKTADIAARFDWVHSVERLKIAQRLSAQRPDTLPPLSVCLQVNISGERSKSGCAPGETAALCEAVAQLPNLRLRGLMCIPEAADDAEAARPAFRDLHQLFKQILADGKIDVGNFDTLSMGMSNDFEIAIEEGATQVRIGSALFGSRDQE